MWVFSMNWRKDLERYRWLKKAGLLDPTLHDARMAAWRIRQDYTKEELEQMIQEASNYGMLDLVRRAALEFVLRNY